MFIFCVGKTDSSHSGKADSGQQNKEDTQPKDFTLAVASKKFIEAVVKGAGSYILSFTYYCFRSCYGSEEGH